MDTLTLLVKPAAGLCNMRCEYCFYRAVSGTRENRVMTRETVDLLLEKVRLRAPLALSVLFQGGEPTLAGLDYYAYFTERAAKTLKCPVSYALQTNGLLLDDAFARFFKARDFLIGVSLDGGAAVNDRYRRGERGESVTARVLEAIALLRRHQVDFNILSVIDDANAADIGATWQFFKEQDFRYLQFIPCVEAGGVTLSPERYAAFLRESFELWYEDYIAGRYISVRHIDNYIGILMGRQPENCAMCGVCGSYFVVEADGSLYPCDFYCGAQDRLGSVADSDPFGLNEKHLAFIRRSERIHAYCAGCGDQFLCRGGCSRDRTDDGTRNRYCEAYREFFRCASGRMNRIAASLTGEQLEPLPF